MSARYVLPNVVFSLVLLVRFGVNGLRGGMRRQHQIMQPGMINVVDVRRDPLSSDFVFHVVDIETDLQSVIPRIELCESDGGKEMVVDALRMIRRGVTPLSETCCIKTSGESKCFVSGESNAPEMEEPHLPDQKNIFLGVHSNYWACPKGYRPLIIKGPFNGADSTCCSFFVHGTTKLTEVSAGTIPEGEDCGAKSCTLLPTLRETAFCEPLGHFNHHMQSMQKGFLSGSLESEIPGDGSCALTVDEANEPDVEETFTSGPEDTGETIVGAVVDKVRTTCEKKNEDAKKTNGKYCSYCRRQTGDAIEKLCTDCSRKERVEMDGFACESFPPEYPCGRKSKIATDTRHFEVVKDFSGAGQYTSSANVNGGGTMETPADYNDGKYRQGGPASTTSPLRAQRRFEKMRKRLHFGDPKQRKFEAVGRCPQLRSLQVESTRDEPLQATAEDFASDSERMIEVMQGLGGSNGLGDMRNILYPRVTATAAFNTPDAIGFYDAASHHFGCSDSRSTDPIVGTPGGDVAEFVLAMNVMEKAWHSQHSTNDLSDEHVLYYFQEFLERMVELTGKQFFFMCVDETALVAWSKAAQVADPTRPRGLGEITRLVDYGVLRDHIGSAHLRQMIQYPAEYRCRPGLVKAVVRAFLTVYYDASHPSRQRLVMGTYAGEYPKNTLLYVKRQEGYKCGNMSPLVTPVSPEATVQEIFVVHEDAVDVYRERLARFVTKKLGYSPDSEAQVHSAMRQIGKRQLQETINRLLPGVEPYIANFMTSLGA